MTEYLGVDIGASGIKGGVVDLEAGEMKGKRHRIPTPQPSTPDAVATVVGRIVDHFGWTGPIGCGLPAVVVDGVARSAANIDPTWIGTNARALFDKATGVPTHVVNDADAAGIAEMRFGAGAGVNGVVLLLTFGSGIGSALFTDGVLVPNTELGHLEFRGAIAEHSAAARLVEHEGLKLARWSERVAAFLAHVAKIFSPSLIIFGGGISKRYDQFGAAFDVGVTIVPAVMRNNAGIIGAAIAAYEAAGRSP